MANKDVASRQSERDGTQPRVVLAAPSQHVTIQAALARAHSSTRIAPMIFKDRHDAGKKLAGKLQHYADKDDVIVLALPRGGVPVAFEVAQNLQAPLDVFIVRKLGLPGQEELAMGAIASRGTIIINEYLVNQLAITDAVIDNVIRREQRELERRELLYRRGRPAYKLERKQIIVVDDGLATGASMRAAVTALKKESPSRIIVAVPIAPKEIAEFEIDETICLAMPERFNSVGAWYEDFTQTTDAEVINLLDQAAKSKM